MTESNKTLVDVTYLKEEINDNQKELQKELVSEMLDVVSDINQAEDKEDWENISEFLHTTASNIDKMIAGVSLVDEVYKRAISKINEN